MCIVLDSSWAGIKRLKKLILKSKITFIYTIKTSGVNNTQVHNYFTFLLLNKTPLTLYGKSICTLYKCSSGKNK